MKMQSRPSLVTVTFVALAILYSALSFILPTSSATKSMYNLTDSEYMLLLFIVRIPIVLTWCLAFYAYRRLRLYANKISDTPEGKHFSKIATGIGWIAWGYAIPALIRTILYAFANQNPSFLSAALIITNYMFVIVTLMAFAYISGGAHQLARAGNIHLSIFQIRSVTAGLTALGILFCVLVASNLDMTSITNTDNAYHLPNWLIWSTIVLPYLFAWASGLFAAMEITILAKESPGIIYRRALFLLASGLVLMVVSLCAAQYILTIIPRTGYLTLGMSLVIIYVIYGIGSIGSVILAWGARRLKQIEEV